MYVGILVAVTAAVSLKMITGHYTAQFFCIIAYKRKFNSRVCQIIDVIKLTSNVV